MQPPNVRLLLAARALEAAGSLRSPAATSLMRRSKSATRLGAVNIRREERREGFAKNNI
jgi:hypothetical protein